MGVTTNRQKAAKEEMDTKLLLSQPNAELLQELAVECSKNPKDPQCTFQYAFALSKSSNATELRYAIGMLDSLIVNGYKHQVDCMYGAAIALYLLGEYSESRVRMVFVRSFRMMRRMLSP